MNDDAAFLEYFADHARCLILVFLTAAAREHPPFASVPKGALHQQDAAVTDDSGLIASVPEGCQEAIEVVRLLERFDEA